jgi:aspartate-semialdehyde dehydrogenase
VETEFAAAGHTVVSNARNHRMDPLVPLLIPEINAEHLELLPHQKKKSGSKGEIVTNPNCSVVALAMALAALLPFRPKRVVVTTMQALSGAGYPGVASLDATANVIPHIEGEEEKIEPETRKILGHYAGGKIEPHPVAISATTTRVPVINGHTESVSVELAEKASREEIVAAFNNYTGPPQKLGLPSAPPQPLVYLDAPAPSRDSTPSEAAAWSSSPGACVRAPSSATNSSSSATTRFAARPAQPS